MNDIPVQLPLCKQGDVQTGVVQILPVYVEGHWHVDGAVFFFKQVKWLDFILVCFCLLTQLPPFWHDGEQIGYWQTLPLYVDEQLQTFGEIHVPLFWQVGEQIAK